MIGKEWLRSTFLYFYIVLFLLTSVGFIVCFQYAHPSLTVFSEGKILEDWSLISYHDQESTLHYEQSSSSIDTEFTLSSSAKQPNAGIALHIDKGVDGFANLSDFSTATLSLKCSSGNTLYFGLSFHDVKVTQRHNPLTYRNAGVFIGCDTEWREVSIKLDSLEIPLWWLHMFGYKASENKYDLNKVIRVYLESSYDSPLDVSSKFYVSNISFSGQREGVLPAFAFFAALIWLVCGAWTIKKYSAQKTREQEVKQELKYEQLTLNPARARDKQLIIDYISKNFADPDIDNSSVCKAVGVSRTKVNEVLKTEYGTTFTNYINKLRLVEASRLLTEKPEAQITEIAYLVGFKNISYFNKLFKEQFGSTPKEVRGKRASQ